MVPSGSIAPGVKLLVKLAIVQLSDAEGGVQLIAASQLPKSVDCEKSFGQLEITGFSISLIVTSN